jgi:hypothetical protein
MLPCFYCACSCLFSLAFLPIQKRAQISAISTHRAIEGVEGYFRENQGKMICEACKKYIEKEIAFFQGKPVNCMGHGCKNGAQCSRRGLVKYCLEMLCPKTPSASEDCPDSAAERKGEDHLESHLPDCSSDQDL